MPQQPSPFVSKPGHTLTQQNDLLFYGQIILGPALRLHQRNELGFHKSFEMVQQVGNSFLPAYLPIVQRRKDLQWGQREKTFQEYRRGRYVEFNLVYDRGTLFGLQFGGRIQSILASLPPTVSWPYQAINTNQLFEKKLIEEFLTVDDWVN